MQQLFNLLDGSIRSNLRQIALSSIPGGGFYPLKQVPVIRLGDDGERGLDVCEWGFLPTWWKPSDKQPKRAAFQRQCFNARSETVDTKPTYRSAFKTRRCLLPAEKFEEKKHYFSFADQRPFAFAGLWETWHGDDGEIYTCTLLTTEPNEEVRSVGHHRMPVILQTEAEYARWLNPEIKERGPLDELMRPLADGSLEVEPIGTLF
ncbi:SOS response-associated peptidase [Lacipirellula parvula]|uniref:Abasic site processing protein n=1 Tax=Lacipirellula parvula TaxID=2650471 RepID=A0A5K7XLY2_9BACT|nr:SOS response-associated peptidase [Lacipirellula parvula]BBO35716.1 hypothetical protein PLANPX_5328 [Lacipirellula parvula]